TLTTSAPSVDVKGHLELIGGTFGTPVTVQSGGHVLGTGNLTAITALTNGRVEPAFQGNLTAQSLTFANGAVLAIPGGNATNLALQLPGNTPLTPSTPTDQLQITLTDNGTLVYGTPTTWTVITSQTPFSGISADNFATPTATNFAFANDPLVIVGS